MNNFNATMDNDPTVEEIAEIRRLAGPKFKIMVDCNNAYTPQEAIRVGRKLQDLDAFRILNTGEVAKLAARS